MTSRIVAGAEVLTAGGQLESITVGDLTQPVAPVACTSSVPDVELLFRRTPGLRAVVVREGSRLSPLTRSQLDATLSGALGFGRALLSRRTVADVTERASLQLAAHMGLVDAASMILGRPAADRYEDVLVVWPDGSAGSVPISRCSSK